jgi:hypothetical protein
MRPTAMRDMRDFYAITPTPTVRGVTLASEAHVDAVPQILPLIFSRHY